MSEQGQRLDLSSALLSGNRESTVQSLADLRQEYLDVPSNNHDFAKIVQYQTKLSQVYTTLGDRVSDDIRSVLFREVQVASLLSQIFPESNGENIEKYLQDTEVLFYRGFGSENVGGALEQFGNVLQDVRGFIKTTHPGYEALWRKYTSVNTTFQNLALAFGSAPVAEQMRRRTSVTKGD